MKKGNKHKRVKSPLATLRGTFQFLDLWDGAGSDNMGDCLNSANQNLDAIHKKMGVQKHRLYDIVNVLEGVGMVERPKRNEVDLKKNIYGKPATNEPTEEQIK